MRLTTPSLLSLALALAGCATTRDRASELFARGEFEASAGEYDTLLREHPEQQDLRLRRDTARARALVQQAEVVRVHRAGGRLAEALGAVDVLLARNDAWAPHSQDAAREAVEREATWARQHLRTEVGRHLEAREPLGAQALMEAQSPLLGRTLLVETQRELTERTQRTGQENCARLVPAAGAEAPYWNELLRRYCEHFGVQRESPPAPSELYGSLAFRGGVEGVVRPHFAVMTGALVQAFQASPWYAPGASGALLADLSGRFEAQVKTERVKREAPWTERVAYTTTKHELKPHQVAYTDTEHRSEQVPYTATETYTVQVPYSATESYTYSCGTGTSYRTCTGYRSVTRHRSETRTRTVTKYRTEMRPHMVTKYRTEYRSEPRTVTDYRNEPRVFTYDADEVSADYRAILAVGLTTTVPVEARHENTLSDRGDRHDVEHGPAHVAPQRPGFPPPGAWLDDQLGVLAQRFGVQLASAWQEAFCAPPVSTLEAASRCLYGHPEAQGLEAPFASVLGGDAPAFIQRVSRTESP